MLILLRRKSQAFRLSPRLGDSQYTKNDKMKKRISFKIIFGFSLSYCFC
nr:MAG TPA: hypothetical protein [Caudoviricetes sp.]